MTLKNLIFSFLIISGIMPLDTYGQEESAFDPLFKRWEDKNILQPGVCVAIIKDGEVMLQQSRGFANLEYKIPLDDHAVFDMASLAKQFTGFAIARMILDKKLSLEDPAAKYLPELSILDQGIRIKHLVYHTSGLRDIGELFGLAYAGQNLTSKETLAIMKNQEELNFSPGEAYDYSNTNYVFLALIVERISGMSFRDWCEKELFAPLKMKNTFVNDNPYEIIENRAIAYYTDQESFSFQQNNGMALIGSSAVYSTLNDMILWLNALQSESVFPREFSLMKQAGTLDNGEKIDYGFGLGIGSLKSQSMIEHTGSTPSGFRTAMAMFPKQALSIIILSNWGNIDPIAEFGIQIIDMLMSDSKVMSEIVDQETKKEQSSAEGFHLSAAQARQYVGDYLFNGERQVKIREGEGNNLSLQLGENDPVPLIPLSATDFDLPAVNSRLTFKIDADGKVSMAEVWSNGNQEGEIRRVSNSNEATIDYQQYAGLYYSEELKVSFELSMVDDQLMIGNTKDGEIALEHTSGDTFIPEKGLASRINFEKDSNQEVSGFLLSRGSRMRNLRFTRLKTGQ